jgi:hypothetical protein
MRVILLVSNTFDFLKMALVKILTGRELMTAIREEWAVNKNIRN